MKPNRIFEMLFHWIERLIALVLEIRARQQVFCIKILINYLYVASGTESHSFGFHRCSLVELIPLASTDPVWAGVIKLQPCMTPQRCKKSFYSLIERTQSISFVNED